MPKMDQGGHPWKPVPKPSRAANWPPTGKQAGHELKPSRNTQGFESGHVLFTTTNMTGGLQKLTTLIGRRCSFHKVVCTCSCDALYSDCRKRQRNSSRCGDNKDEDDSGSTSGSKGEQSFKVKGRPQKRRAACARLTIMADRICSFGFIFCFWLRAMNLWIGCVMSRHQQATMRQLQMW